MAATPEDIALRRASRRLTEAHLIDVTFRIASQTKMPNWEEFEWFWCWLWNHRHDRNVISLAPRA